MIKFFTTWRANQRAKAFQQGYEFAAGVLIKSGPRNDEVIRELEERADNPFNHSHPFDKGVLSAVGDYEKLLEKVR